MYLLDTNVISEIRKGRKANEGVRKFLAGLVSSHTKLFLSVITLGELRCGVERIRQRGDLRQGDRLELWLQSVLDDFHNHVLDFDAEAAQLWGVLQAAGPQNAVDKQIAATALLYGLTVVTRNDGDFKETGVEVLNPWSRS